jgi:hypothetical protein
MWCPRMRRTLPRRCRRSLRRWRGRGGEWAGRRVKPAARRRRTSRRDGGGTNSERPPRRPKRGLQVRATRGGHAKACATRERAARTPPGQPAGRRRASRRDAGAPKAGVSAPKAAQAAKAPRYGATYSPACTPGSASTVSLVVARKSPERRRMVYSPGRT